jgi:plastocyanin
MFAMRVRKFLIVAVLLLIAVTLYIRADIAPADGAQPTNSGSVTVTDSAIIPTSVTILARGSVVWTNRGSRLHKIVSSHGAFNPFELTPADAYRVLFLRPGVYPYTVDGVIKGAVIVLTGGVPAAHAPTKPSPTPGPPRHFWKGTVHATATTRTHVPCSPLAEHCVNGIIRGGPWTGTYDGTLILAEDSDGLITGQGRVTMLSCKFPGPPPRPPAKHISFEVRGVDDGKKLSLQIIQSSYHADGPTCGFAYGWVETPGGSPSAAVIPITAPGTAQGPWHGRAELPPSPPGPFSTASYTIDYQFAFTCTDCQRPK